MPVQAGPNIVKDNLIVYLDGFNQNSYSGSGDIQENLIQNQYSCSLSNDPTFNSNYLPYYS